MTALKKIFTGYTEVTTSNLIDELPTLQGGVNKKTTLQKVYNLFKTSFDTVYTTTSAVATQISNALTNYATQIYASNAANTAASSALISANSYTDSAVSTKQDKQALSIVDIDAQSNPELSEQNCILAISNIPSGTGEREIKIRLGGDFTVTDWVSLNVRYKGQDINVRSWDIYTQSTDLYLSIYINVHNKLLQPVQIALNKIN